MPFLTQLFPQPNPTYNRAMPEGYLTTKQAAEQLGMYVVRTTCRKSPGRMREADQLPIIAPSS